MAGKPETRKEEVRKLMEEVEQEKRRKREIAGKHEEIIKAATSLIDVFIVANITLMFSCLLAITSFFTGQIVLGILSFVVVLLTLILVERLYITDDRMFPIRCGEFRLTEELERRKR